MFSDVHTLSLPRRLIYAFVVSAADVLQGVALQLEGKERNTCCTVALILLRSAL